MMQVVTDFGVIDVLVRENEECKAVIFLITSKGNGIADSIQIMASDQARALARALGMAADDCDEDNKERD